MVSGSEMAFAGQHLLLAQVEVAQKREETVSGQVQATTKAPQAIASNDFPTEAILLILSFLFFISLLVGKAGSRYGVPVLVLFLAVGMVYGTFWANHQVSYDLAQVAGGANLAQAIGVANNDFAQTIGGANYDLAKAIGTIALAVILFSGGLDTKIQEVRPIMAPGMLLATVGVLLTAFITGSLIWGWASIFTTTGQAPGFLTCLLLASVMSSTDSASVFSILRSKGLALKHNLRPLLELESGSNDPMAYMLTICLISIITTPGDISYWGPVATFLVQLIFGCLSGYLFGRLTVFVANHIEIDNVSLYPILSFTAAIFVYSFTDLIHGNGFLAVYICGLVIGNSKMIHKRSTLRFFDGFAWLCQILMFLTLGLLVDAKELIAWNVLVPGIVISILMIFITRPASVFLCLAPMRNFSRRDKLFISWVGLRGAVPIIFAIFPLVAGVPNAKYIFNIVFFITLVSLLLQGTTLANVAKMLRLVDKASINRAKAKEFDLELCADMGSFTTEITINEKALKHGNILMELPLPEKAVVVLLKRGGKYIVPTGQTHIFLNDILLIITDDEKVINQTFEALAINAVH
jgi:cell volume regulation protein A